MENKDQRILTIIIVTTVLILVIIFAGVTYAFFTANNPEGSTAQIISETGRMLITYDDGTDSIVPVSGIVPSNTILVNKTFTLTGSNTTVGMSSSDGLDMSYNVGVEYLSTFSDGMIHYYIKEIERPTTSNVTTEYTGETNKTVQGNDNLTGYSHGTFKYGNRYTEMVSGKFPASLNDQTIKFNLIIQFPDNNENQDSEKGKTFTGKIIINNENNKVSQVIADLYDSTEKDENGITTDGLQKDGTGAYNIQTLSTTNKKYTVNLLDNTISSSNTDIYDNLRYVGPNPNNYIAFNDETWRIIGIFNVFNVETNKYENLVKIIRDESLGLYSWDTSDSTINSGYGVNEWSQADLMYELNCDGNLSSSYCRSEDIIDGYLSNLTDGNANWYSGSKNENNATYNYSKNIKHSSIDKIAKVRWNTSRVTYNASVLNSYNQERSTTLISMPSDNVQRTNTWDGKIALMYPSDYGYASTDTICRSGLSSTNCKNENWLFNNAYQWTLSPCSGHAFSVYRVNLSGEISNVIYPNVSNHIRPVLFLKSNVVITEGTGTESDPFILD